MYEINKYPVDSKQNISNININILHTIRINLIM